MAKTTLPQALGRVGTPAVILNKHYIQLTGTLSSAVLLSHLLTLSATHDGAQFRQTGPQLCHDLGFTLKMIYAATKKLSRYIEVESKGDRNSRHWIVNEDLVAEDLRNIMGKEA